MGVLDSKMLKTSINYTFTVTFVLKYSRENRKDGEV